MPLYNEKKKRVVPEGGVMWAETCSCECDCAGRLRQLFIGALKLHLLPSLGTKLTAHLIP